MEGKNYGGRYSGNRKGNSKGYIGGYIGAPYNFVPFPETVIPYDLEKPVPHHLISENLLSGEINYTITAKSPIFIDDGQKRFWRNPYGEEAIPGSSLRGLCRTNAQILSLSGIADDVDDYALMYRNVASGMQKKYYGTVLGADQICIEAGKKKQRMSILKNVRVGYLVNQDGKYLIYDTDIDKISFSSDKTKTEESVMNYYVLSERKLAEEYKKAGNKKGQFRYPFFVKKADNKNPKFITQNMLNADFRRYTDKKERVHYKGEKENADYTPYALPCSYSLSGMEVTGVAEPGVLPRKGYAVSTGKMNEKKAIYIIPEVNKKKKRFRDKTHNITFPITIPEEDLKAFQADFNKKKSTLGNFGKLDDFNLPDPGSENMRPVFYILEGTRLYFGFTPRLRLFYKHTIREGLPKAHQKAELDFVKAIFGYTDTDNREKGKDKEKNKDKNKDKVKGYGNYKSRVSFSDAVIQEQKKLTEQQHVILGEPRPTSCCDYLMPKGRNAMTYNDPGFQLRGIKQYWLREETCSNAPEEKWNEDYAYKFQALDRGTVFRGKVRFHNLRREELGLLLWSLHLDGKSWMNIGKAKAFGYGIIQLHVDEVKVLDHQKAYDLSSFTMDPYSPEDRDALIREYKSFINHLLEQSGEVKLRRKKIDELESVVSLFAMKDPDRKPDPEKIRFMELKEYKNRKEPLGTIPSIIGQELK